MFGNIMKSSQSGIFCTFFFNHSLVKELMLGGMQEIGCKVVLCLSVVENVEESIINLWLSILD